MRHNLINARKTHNRREGATQKETATAIGVSERYYRHIGNGTREGKSHIWDALEDLFGIPQRELRNNSPQGHSSRD